MHLKRYYEATDILKQQVHSWTLNHLWSHRRKIRWQTPQNIRTPSCLLKLHLPQVCRYRKQYSQLLRYRLEVCIILWKGLISFLPRSSSCTTSYVLLRLFNPEYNSSRHFRISFTVNACMMTYNSPRLQFIRIWEKSYASSVSHSSIINSRGGSVKYCLILSSSHKIPQSFSTTGKFLYQQFSICDFSLYKLLNYKFQIRLQILLHDWLYLF